MGCRVFAHTQSVVTPILVIPESNQVVERILRVTSTPMITKSAVIDKKVVVSGHIDIQIEYVACGLGCTQPVHFASFKVPFSDFIEHCRARPGQEARLGAAVEYQEFKVENRRTVAGLLILRLCLLRIEAARQLIKSCTTLTGTETCRKKHWPVCACEPVVSEPCEGQACSCVEINC